MAKATGKYDSTELTVRLLQDVLPGFLKGVQKTHDERPDLILASWPEIVGKTLAPMTEAVSFRKGILTIRVENSSLLALLSQQERERLLKILRGRFPGVEIQNIVFRIG